jgi:hypothetical protein
VTWVPYGGGFWALFDTPFKLPERVALIDEEMYERKLREHWGVV